MAKRRFATEDQEREYWASHDAADEIDWSKAVRATLSELKPSVRTISLRLPESMLDGLKILANKKDVPYQSLIKVFLAERLDQEMDTRPERRKLPARGTAKGKRPLRSVASRG